MILQPVPKKNGYVEGINYHFPTFRDNKHLYIVQG